MTLKLDKEDIENMVEDKVENYLDKKLEETEDIRETVSYNDKIDKAKLTKLHFQNAKLLCDIKLKNIKANDIIEKSMLQGIEIQKEESRKKGFTTLLVFIGLVWFLSIFLIN